MRARGISFKRIHAARQAYHEWMPIRTGPQGDQGVIYRAFQIGDLADLIMLDTRLVGRDEQLDYAEGIERAGSVEAFLKNDLYNPERQMLGKEQEAWLQSELQESKARGAIWQVLGQQVLMGKLNIPVIPPRSSPSSSSRSTRNPVWPRPSNWRPMVCHPTSTPGTATPPPEKGCLPCSVPTPPTRSLWPAIPTMAGPLT